MSDLFVEESHFNGKGFKMIVYIDANFNPSGAVDSLGYIFNMIDIKRPLKNRWSPSKLASPVSLSPLKWGASPSTRLSRLVLCSAPSVQLIKPLFRNSVLGVTPYLLPAFKWLLSSVSCMTRILGRDPSAAVENQSATHWQTQPTQEIMEIHMNASRPSLSATT
jgi:hypothetical protein